LEFNPLGFAALLAEEVVEEEEEVLVVLVRLAVLSSPVVVELDVFAIDASVDVESSST
jgi:hypothetical protein